jgi:nucleoside-diphosphate-sugar epimerase
MRSPRDVAELENLLSQPTAGVLDTLRSLPGDLIVLGAGGKMGPTLARMIRRGLDAVEHSSRRVFAASRFSSAAASESLQRSGVATIPCDLTNREAIQSLPDAENVIFMVGQKFGTRDAPELTWITNTLAPALVAERYAKSRIVVLSTGCVYPLAAIDGPGSREDDPLGPPGEYANSCVGRERVFTHFSKLNGTPMLMLRLCYAIDLRYGVLLDLAQKVMQRQPVDVHMGATHVIWQGDANARVIQGLSHATSPPAAVNVTGRERLTIRTLALRLGELLERDVQFSGEEARTAWVWDAQKSYEWFGCPEVTVEEMLQATADWVLRGGETLNRPTHFEVRNGRF